MTTASPLYPAGKCLELACLESLAQIGGSEARSIIEGYRADASKSYLHAELDALDTNTSAAVPVKNNSSAKKSSSLVIDLYSNGISKSWMS